MLLYFIVIQSITLFCSHLFSTSSISAAISVIIIYLTTSVGGYVLHIKDIPFYWKWMEYVSPERWIYPVLLVNEFSHDTLTNSATQHLCRNRQVRNNCLSVGCLNHRSLHRNVHSKYNRCLWYTQIKSLSFYVCHYVLVYYF